MDGQPKFGAWQIILAGMATAALLLWFDGSDSVPVMLVSAVVFLGLFWRFRATPARRELTHAEQIMLERQSVYRWLASQSDEPEPEPEPKKPRPKLTVIEGGKSAVPSEEKPN